jgi:hypothetical protein
MRLKLLDIFPQWRLYLMAGAAVLVVGCWAYVTHLQHIARAQKQQLALAARQAKIQTVATAAVDQVATKTQAVQERTHVVIQRIKAAPGADAPIPAGVLAEWRSGLRDGPDDPSY